MRCIAILGATSHLARDLITVFAKELDTDAVLFTRHPETVKRWTYVNGFGNRFPIFDYNTFYNGNYDAIINFVGIGDPARIACMGREIFDLTLRFDQLALDYMKRHSGCRYLFLSSGAVYGGTFDQPVDQATPTRLSTNALSPKDYYAVAKLHAECRHRALSGLPIIDIRVFSYFSRTQKLEARFFISDILRAICEHRTLQTSSHAMVRDFLHPSDFRSLIGHLLAAAPVNVAVDCYSQASIDKLTLLAEMHKTFNLNYMASEQAETFDATGIKPNYYSLNRKAAEFNYFPTHSSLSCILQESAALLASIV